MLSDISRTDWVYQIILGKYMIFLQIFYENKKNKISEIFRTDLDFNWQGTNFDVSAKLYEELLN